MPEGIADGDERREQEHEHKEQWPRRQPGRLVVQLELLVVLATAPHPARHQQREHEQRREPEGYDGHDHDRIGQVDFRESVSCSLAREF